MPSGGSRWKDAGDSTAEVDLSDVRQLVSVALELTHNLDGRNPPTGNNPQRAEVKRDLIYLADLLDRAGSEVRAVYHLLNGQRDPLRED